MSEYAVEDQLNRYGSCLVPIHGVSMRPLLKEGRDAALLVKPKSAPKPMDVVLYRGDRGNYVLHRIIREQKDFYLIRGDNTFFREYIRKENIIAVMDGYVKKGKRRSVNSFSYKLYSRFWRFLYPIRRVWFLAASFVKRALGKLKRIIKGV